MENLGHEELPPEERVIGICGCGRPLNPSILNGKRVGVTHFDPDDDDHHMLYFASLRVEFRDDPQEKSLQGDNA
jgi:hypothetical protein